MDFMDIIMALDIIFKIWIFLKYHYGPYFKT
jgi:hypothetical protein